MIGSEIEMSDLVVIEFPSEAKAEEVRQKLLDMQKEYLIELEDAVIAIKQPSGRIKLNQLFHPAAAGAAYGSLWGLLVGMIFLMPLGGHSSRNGIRCHQRGANRCWDQRPLHEGCRRNSRIGKCRALPPDPQDDHRQGAGRP
jgi:hypothetical protein